MEGRREGEEGAKKIPLRAKDSGWAELLHIIIITVVVVIIVVNGVGCYCERGRDGVSQSLIIYRQNLASQEGYHNLGLAGI